MVSQQIPRIFCLWPTFSDNVNFYVRDIIFYHFIETRYIQNVRIRKWHT